MTKPRRNFPKPAPRSARREPAPDVAPAAAILRAPPRARGEIDVGGRPAGWVREGEIDARPVVLLAHGAGAPYTSPFMEATAVGLVQRGTTVVRFHFPYMERNVREGQRRPPDRADVLLETVRRMLDLVRGWQPVAPTVLAGKSMGGRIMSMLLAEEVPAGAPPLASGAAYLGYPLQPAGQPHKLRADHLLRVGVPQLFVSGTRDSLCDLELLRAALLPLGARARLHVVEGGDHSLATSRREPLAGSAVWLDVMADFVREVTRRPASG
jgi:hypothetical protein